MRSKWREKMERLFAAEAFAEAGCHDMARELMATPEIAKPGGFLTAVGLNGVRVWWGEARLSDPFDFAAAIGLKGVRVVYGVAHVS
jgi:hypothetical protein